MLVGRHHVASIESRDASPWFAGVCLGFATIVFGLIFRREVEGAVGVWLTSTAYNHCFLIIPISAYLAWDRRAALARLTPRPEFRVFPALFLLSLLWVVARGLDILEARQFIVMAMFQVIVIGILGWRFYRALLAPFLFLFLLIPSGEFLVPWLQDFTARFVVAGLGVVGVPVYADGTIIEIPAGTFVVAEACAGLRFLIASLAFGIFYGVLVYRSVFRRIAFVVLSLIVPMIANWVRAFGIVYLASIAGSAQAVMADHIIYGWGFFAAVTVVLILVGYTFSDGGGAHFRFRGNRDGSIASGARSTVIIAGAVAAVGFASVGPIYVALMGTPSGEGPLFAALPPAVAAPWRSIPTPGNSWKPLIIEPDKEFLTTYSDGKHHVTFYLALYRTRGADNNLVRAQNRMADEKLWHLAATRAVPVAIDGKQELIGANEFIDRDRRLVVWHFYVVDEKILPSALMAKLYQTRDFIVGGYTVAAIVGLAAEVGEGEGRTDNVLRSFLDAVAPLPNYLRNLASDHH